MLGKLEFKAPRRARAAALALAVLLATGCGQAPPSSAAPEANASRSTAAGGTDPTRTRAGLPLPASNPPPVQWGTGQRRAESSDKGSSSTVARSRAASSPTHGHGAAPVRSEGAASRPSPRGVEALPRVTFDAPQPEQDAEQGHRSAIVEPAAPKHRAPSRRAVVDVSAQTLTVLDGARPLARYPISTAARGVGSAEASYRTPLGRHRVCEKFGHAAPLGTVFRSRVDTGAIAPILTEPLDVEEDLILTRILWLDGLEPGLNRGPGIDSRARFIYIHGTNEEGLIGTPASHGCVRMRNRDVVALFDQLAIGAEVEIVRSRR